jgi:hypothetical protein
VPLNINGRDERLDKAVKVEAALAGELQCGACGAFKSEVEFFKFMKHMPTVNRICAFCWEPMTPQQRDDHMTRR